MRQELSEKSTCKMNLYLSVRVLTMVILFGDVAIKPYSSAQETPDLAPNTDCDSYQDVFQGCISEQLSSAEKSACDFCVARAIVAAPTENCDDLNDSVCTAIYRACECGTCQAPLEQLMDCSIREIFSCSVDCEAGSPAAEPTESPTVSPVVAGSPTVTPSGLDCDAVQANFQSCLDNDIEGGQACENCVASSIPSVVESCSSFETTVCTAISNCSCGSCRGFIQDFVNCAFEETTGCLLDCEDAAPTATSSPSIDPTSTTATPSDMSPSSVSDQCSYVRSNLQECFSNNLDETQINECNSCVANSFPAPTDDCNSVTSDVCDSIVTCPCDPCQGEIESLLDCAFQESVGCSLECDFAPDCNNVQTNLQECMDSHLSPDAAQSCNTCISESIPSPDETDCSVFDSVLCPNLATCGCEPCGQAIEDLLNCAFVESNQCQLDCENVATPTMQPGSAESCGVERDTLRTCFDSNLSDQEITDCDSCVTNSFPSDFTNCDDLSSAVCTGVAECPCGSCQSIIENFVACSFQDKIGCDVMCESVLTPTTSESPPILEPTTSASMTQAVASSMAMALVFMSLSPLFWV